MILGALNDDIAEMAEVDVASSNRNYRGYFAGHLEYREITAGAPDGRLLLLRYDSNTICGADDNCPVWVIELLNGKKEKAVSLIGWRPGFGTSAQGAWGVATPIGEPPAFPELMFLTHLSRYQTEAHCYKKTARYYIQVECSPPCADAVRRLQRPPDTSRDDIH